MEDDPRWVYGDPPHGNANYVWFPDMKGWASSNLKYMRFFAQHCPSRQFGQQAADQLSWFRVVTLLTKLDDATAREW